MHHGPPEPARHAGGAEAVGVDVVLPGAVDCSFTNSCQADVSAGFLTRLMRVPRVSGNAPFVTRGIAKLTGPDGTAARIRPGLHGRVTLEHVMNLLDAPPTPSRP